MNEYKNEYAKVEGIVEATSFEKFALWFMNPDYVWGPQNFGWGEAIGDSFVSIFIQELNGKRILFWHATSKRVDYNDIEKWLDEKFPGIPRTDAQNIHSLLT